MIINAIHDKRELIAELKKRISICERSCISLKDMQLQLGQMKSNNQVDPSFQEEYQKLKIVVDQQKLQLQSDVHFLLEKDTPFVEQCIDIVHLPLSFHLGIWNDAAIGCAYPLAVCKGASKVFAGSVGALCGRKGGL